MLNNLVGIDSLKDVGAIAFWFNKDENATEDLALELTVVDQDGNPTVDVRQAIVLKSNGQTSPHIRLGFRIGSDTLRKLADLMDHVNQLIRQEIENNTAVA